jgi:mono/diheme cytochrome c family protein
MSKRTASFIVPLACAATLAAPAARADAAAGQQLHDRHCQSCHGTEVYTRDNRRVGSYVALEGQVKRCQGAAGAAWNRQQTADVIDYLNTAFYKFTP